MATLAANFMKLLSCRTCYVPPFNFLRVQPNLMQVRNYPARKGTREKRLKLQRAMKKKAEAQKSSQPPPKKKSSVPHTPRRINDSLRPDPLDNVVIVEKYKLKTYEFHEAIQCHRESHHPTVHNTPNALVQAIIELDMKAAKKNRFVSKFTRIVSVPYPFDHGEDRNIVFFCKTPELQKEAADAGIPLTGGTELIKNVETGIINLNDYQFVLAHPNILPELVVIRGLMKGRFPNVQNGTLTVNVTNMVPRLLTGIQYSSQKDTYEEDYGWIETNIGQLDMDIQHLEENLKAILQDVHSAKPKRPDPFITRCFLSSPPYEERLKLNLEALMPTTTAADDDESDDEDNIIMKN